MCACVVVVGGGGGCGWGARAGLRGAGPSGSMADPPCSSLVVHQLQQPLAGHIPFGTPPKGQNFGRLQPPRPAPRPCASLPPALPTASLPASPAGQPPQDDPRFTKDALWHATRRPEPYRHAMKKTIDEVGGAVGLAAGRGVRRSDQAWEQAGWWRRGGRMGRLWWVRYAGRVSVGAFCPVGTPGSDSPPPLTVPPPAP